LKYALALLIVGWASQTIWFHSLPRAQLNVESHPVRVTVATTPWSRYWGLMLRPSLGDGEGMLFVFSKPTKVCMWMKYTFVPLSVAFIRRDGIITDMDNMEPMTRAMHCSTDPVEYALEVPKGWFVSRGIKIGSKVAALPTPSR